jgi:hypothetical protein
MLNNSDNPFFDELKKIRAEISPTDPEDYSALENASDEYIQSLIATGAKKRNIRISDLNKYLKQLGEEDFDELALTLIKVFEEEKKEN